MSISMLLSTQNAILFRMLMNIIKEYLRDDGTTPIYEVNIGNGASPETFMQCAKELKESGLPNVSLAAHLRINPDSWPVPLPAHPFSGTLSCTWASPCGSPRSTRAAVRRRGRSAIRRRRIAETVTRIPARRRRPPGANRRVALRRRDAALDVRLPTKSMEGSPSWSEPR